MSSSIDKYIEEHPALCAYVLRNCSPEDVGKAIIKDGGQQQPFFIFDMDETYRHVQRFRQNLPRVQMFYAMKSNDSEMMIKLAIALGLGFDCASPGEIHRIRQFNVCPSSIIYAVTMKTPEQMMYARDSGVVHTTFDSSFELKKLKQYWPDARLLIRIKIDSDSVYQLGEKFGCDFETEAVDLLEEASRLGLTVAGVAFHVGSGCLGIQSYMVGLQRAKALFEHESRAGRGMKILDIGGGFFGGDFDRFDKVSKIIRQGLEELFPDPDVQVIAEPGRYVCESAFTMYCNINNVRKITELGKPVNMLYINDGIHGTLRSYEQWHTINKFQSSANDDEKFETILWGPSGDSTDCMPPVQLPECTHEDWLVFGLQGAYTYCFAGKYSGFEKPLVRPVVSTELWNKLKNKCIFGSKDFMKDPDISKPLPSTMPPLIPEPKTYENFSFPALCE